MNHQEHRHGPRRVAIEEGWDEKALEMKGHWREAQKETEHSVGPLEREWDQGVLEVAHEGLAERALLEKIARLVGRSGEQECLEKE